MKIIELNKINDPRGNLTFLQNNEQIPFRIERTYWLYDVPGGELREGHAFKKNKEFIIALSGSFDIEIQYEENCKVYTLNRPYKGLYIPNLKWRRITNFSTNSVALIVSSTKFDTNDYIKNLETLKKLTFE